jgi:phage tail P2-like protein
MHLLPPNASDTEIAVSLTAAAIDGLPTPARLMWDPATVPVAFLPWLAWSLSVDDWDATWSVETQREVIAASLFVHRRKGTVASIRRQLAVMGYGDVDITEHWQTVVGASWVVGDTTPVGWQSLVGGAWIVGDATPVGGNHWAEYWITVRAPITPAMVASIARRLATVAPARCHLTKLIVDAVTVVVGADWAVGDAAVTVGATYPVEAF